MLQNDQGAQDEMRCKKKMKEEIFWILWDLGCPRIIFLGGGLGSPWDNIANPGYLEFYLPGTLGYPIWFFFIIFYFADFANKEERRKQIQVRPKGRFLLQMLFPIYNCKCKGLQGSTLCGPVFCNFFKRILKKKTSVLEKVNFLSLWRFVSFFLCFWWQAIISSELVFWINTKSQWAPLRFSIEKSGFFWKLFAAIASAAPLLQMPWTSLIENQ